MHKNKENKPLVLHVSSSTVPIGGIATYITRISNSKLSKHYRFTTIQYPTSRLWHFGALVKLYYHIRRSSPDIVHVHGLQTEGVIGVFAARLASAPSIMLTIHGLMRDSLTTAWWRVAIVTKAIEPIAYMLSSAHYFVSAYGADDPIAKKYYHKSFGTVNNSLPSPTSHNTQTEKIAFRKNGKCLQAVYVGRITFDKGVFDLVEIAAILNDSAARSPVHFTVIGDGPAMPTLIREVEIANLCESFTFAGFCTDVQHHYKRADVLVLPSRHEHQSFAVLEAMHEGRPVVAYDVGGNKELIVPGETGFLCPKGDVAQMATALETLAMNPTLGNDMGNAARQRQNAFFNEGHFTATLNKHYSRLDY